MVQTDAANAFAQGLFKDLGPRYDALAELLSFGQNGRWRRELVSHVAAASPVRILDVATGTAGVAIALATACDAEIVGVDISEAMLARGRRNVSAAGLDSRISLQLARAEALPFEDAAFDAVSFTYLLRYVEDMEATIAELSRVLAPGGVMASLDFAVPSNPVWLGAWKLYTRTLLPIGGLALGGRSWWDVGRFLGPNIEAHYRRRPVGDIVAAWGSAGMEDVGWRAISAGGGLVMWGEKSAKQSAKNNG